MASSSGRVPAWISGSAVIAASRAWLLLLLMLLGGALLDVASASAQQAPTDREIAESQRRLDQIRRERAQLQQEMARISARVTDISSELRNVERQVGASAGVLNELDFQLQARQQQIAQTTFELLSTQDRLAERRAVLHRRMRDIYKRGPLHSTEVLLTSSSFSDLLNRYRYLFVVARRDRALMAEVSQLESQLVVRERTLRRSLGDLQRLLEEKASEHSYLEMLEVQQRSALTSTRAQERSATARMQQLAQDERRLGQLIAGLELKRREAERIAEARRRAAPPGTATPPPSGAGFTPADRGRFGWPLEGRVLYRFGRVTQPNGTVLRFNGIGIAAARGTRVRAIEAGTVVMAGPFEGYGPTVVISHGGGYYSLYLHLRDISVKEGDDVTRSQQIGGVGGENTPEGPHIEFQIRAPGGEAVDPLIWLQRRAP
ncbi:murein hydrolase activator EnvC [soil metagenome]